MEKLDSIIFDLDGTLWSTIESSVKAVSEIKSKYKDIINDVTEEDIRNSMGLPFDAIVEKYYGYLEKSKAEKYTRESMELNIKNLMKNGGTLYPKMQETIKKLSKNYKLFIVSNCIEGYIESFLNCSLLGDYFEDFENNGRTGLSKGENIKLVIKRNNLKNAIYVGDTIGDKKAADIAGIKFIYASYGFGNVEEYDYKIDEISQLCQILNV